MKTLFRGEVGMEQAETESVNTIKIRIYSRGYHDGSIYSYDIPLHRIMLDLMEDIASALGQFDFDRGIECDDPEDDECYKEAYRELGEDQDEAIEKIQEVATKWESKIQLPYVYWHENACDEYDNCYYIINLADISDVFRWWKNPRDWITVDVLSTEYQINIYDSDGLVFYYPKIRTSIHNVVIPDVFRLQWYRNDLNKLIDMIQYIIVGIYYPIPHSPDEEIVNEDEIRIG
jgi:hypothetical protein